MCLICGSEESEPHFGGTSCRACAAFFRRYFKSKKENINCTCKQRQSRSHPCRKCRIEKCFSTGMTPDKLQGNRDRNSIDVLPMTPSGSSSESSPPSLLSTQIVPRTTTNLDFAIPNWQRYEKMREKYIGGIMEWMNIYELTKMTETNYELTWNMVSIMFPSTSKLEEKDKSALLRNFIPKLWQIAPIFDCIKNYDYYEKLNDTQYEKMIVSFYKGSFVEGKELSNKEIMRVFEPFWDSFYNKTAPPIIGLNLEKEELMAIIWLLFFDNCKIFFNLTNLKFFEKICFISGYTNISLECLEMCRNIKKVILRELKNFQNEKNYDEMRFFDTVETLEIIDRGEKKFMGEMMICEMHNVRLHDEFKAILMENKY
ncbi:hypothetical protein CRE_09074 [Caenorhabditis remanei]|uniref:Nuclear receptor domain-containing protein n=1 Tax=Caenorhabditis remanei TaxID=31234 RepID=E3LJ00_CAERE|nr:hypothetical protein CRE_09074 [Caenorhabditis remanei]